MEVWAVIYKPESFTEDATPGLNPPIAYNISHDNALVAISFAPGIHNPPAFSVGIDVMKVRIPGRDTLASFVESVSDTLTPFEYRELFSLASQDETLRRFFWLWTMKEAYTKSLGLGLGFDFRRVEYDVNENVVRIDKKIAVGWRFTKFVLKDEDDLYQGVVAEYIGGSNLEIIDEFTSQRCLVAWDAVQFVETALVELKEE
ncbi:hypothetical protein H0H87_001212 [Tephrocybe sp. NHM501043]|nr:hypothetical protein H0H87_001212 [Tephrocybe sp. NHM501043]